MSPEPKPAPESPGNDKADDFFNNIEADLRAAESESLFQDQNRLRDSVRRLTEEKERLLRLLDVSRSINSVLSTRDVLDRVMDAVMTISAAQRGFLVLLDSEGSLRLELTRNLDGDDSPAEDVFSGSESILRQAIETGRTIVVGDALNNPAFTASKSVHEYALQTVICLPLRLDQKVLGAIYLDSQSISELMSTEGQRLLEAFASQAAVAIGNARTHDALRAFQTQLQVENRTLKRALRSEYSFDSIIGRSPAIRRVFDVLEKVAVQPVTVLINGETGTGKELVARAIHNSGSRPSAPFVPINCGSIPESLLEAELFGYRRGSFTGANEDRAGLFEAAQGGTLFLDEIGEMPLILQVRLLRVLQDKEVRRLGETHMRRVDFRLLTATHRDLAREVAAGRFREDLYYRLKVVTVTLPSLRERPEDILLLAEHFLRGAASRMNRENLSLSREARSVLLAHGWPGNVRELENAIERAVALSSGEFVTGEHLLPEGSAAVQEPTTGTLRDRMTRAERVSIEAALRRTGGNISRAAQALGVSRQHLHNRIKKLGINGNSRPAPALD